MLEKSVKLNLSMMEPFQKKLRTVTYIVLCLLVVCTTAVPVMLQVAAVVAAIWNGIMIGIFIGIFRQVFHQSLFGEDGATYMQFPISSKAVVAGKQLAVWYSMVFFAVLASAIWYAIYLYWRDTWVGVVIWDYNFVECIFDDLNFLGNRIFGCGVSAKAAVFLIGTSLMQIVLVCAVLCSGVQLGTILNHVYNRGSGKRYLPVLLVLAGTAVFTGCLYLPTKIFSVIGGVEITVFPLAVTTGLEIALVILWTHWSVKLLQTKYELN